MLLDQQRTRRITKVVAIIMVVGLVGVLPVALGLIIFGGGGDPTGQQQLLEEAEAKVRENPESVEALVELATRYQTDGQNAKYADTLQRAIAAAPDNADELGLLVGALTTQQGKQVVVLKAYTKRFPKDAEGWFLYGTTAEAQGQTLTARLAYQRALENAKAGSDIADNARTAIERLKTATTPTVVPTTPGS